MERGGLGGELGGRKAQAGRALENDLTVRQRETAESANRESVIAEGRKSKIKKRRWFRREKS